LREGATRFRLVAHREDVLAVGDQPGVSCALAAAAVAAAAANAADAAA